MFLQRSRMLISENSWLWTEWEIGNTIRERERCARKRQLLERHLRHRTQGESMHTERSILAGREGKWGKPGRLCGGKKARKTTRLTRAEEGGGGGGSMWDRARWDPPKPTARWFSVLRTENPYVWVRFPFPFFPFSCFLASFFIPAACWPPSTLRSTL